MNPLILIWSRNPDLFLVFDHILAVEGFRAGLIDDRDLDEDAMKAPALALLVDAEGDADRALHLCRLVKENPATAHIPLFVLLPGGNERRYLEFLKVGVDECFIRPVSPARILTCLRMLASGMPSGARAIRRHACTFTVGEMTLEQDRRLVRRGEEEVQLGPIEFKLLCRLLEAPGRVFSRPELIEAAWPPNHYVQPRTVDVHMSHLRRLLMEMTGRNIIRTIRSSGYAAEFS